MSPRPAWTKQWNSLKNHKQGQYWISHLFAFKSVLELLYLNFFLFFNVLKITEENTVIMS